MKIKLFILEIPFFWDMKLQQQVIGSHRFRQHIALIFEQHCIVEKWNAWLYCCKSPKTQFDLCFIGFLAVE
jgi:hypothetical protein